MRATAFAVSSTTVLLAMALQGCGDAKIKDRNLGNFEPPDLCAKSEIRIMPLGDSFTAGIDMLGRDFGGTSGAYRTLLWAKLQTVNTKVAMVGDRVNGPDWYGPAARNHEGLPGWKIDNFLNGNGPALDPAVQGALADWVTSAAPDIIVIIPGPEDLWRQNDIRKSFAEYVVDVPVVNYIDMLMRLAPQAYIIIGNHPPVGHPGDGNDGWLQAVRWFNDELSSVITADYTPRSATAQVRSVDLFSHLDGASNIAGDGGHPTAAGYERIARVFNDIVAPLVQCNQGQ